MLLLRNATVFAPESRGRMDLLIGGEQILWMGASLSGLPSALDVSEVDLDGRVVLAQQQRWQVLF